MNLYITAFIFLLSLSKLSVAADVVETSPELTVRGEAVLTVSPDQVQMVAGVLTESKDAKEALSLNSKKMQQVMRVFESLDIDKKDITTQNFSVQPVWSPRPRNVGSEWRAKIIAYKVRNNVVLKTTKLDLIGDLITAATNAGANNIASINFGLSNPRQYRERALSQAVVNAREDANTAAKAAGIKVKGVKKIQIDQAVQSIERVEKAQLMRSSMADAAPAVPINAGDVSVRASVYMTFELSE